MKTPYFHRDRGYMLFAATLVMSLGVVGLSMSMMRTSHRMLDNVRSASVTNEISTKDLALRRQVGDDLMQQIVNAVNSGRTSATLGDVSGRYSTGNVGGQSREAVSLNLTDSGAATGRSVAAGNSVALTVSAWSPTGGPYSAITLPVGPYRVKGGTVIGREFRVDYTRGLTVADNVGNNTRTLTKTSSARIIEFPSQTALWGRSLRVRQGTVGGRRWLIHEQCSDCGKLFRRQLPFSLLGDAPPDSLRDCDLEAAKHYESAFYSAASALRSIFNTVRIRDWWSQYSNYLESDAWRSRSRDTIAAADGICTYCLQRQAVQAHHVNYSRVGNEHPKDLRAICLECHRQKHPRMRKS